MRGLCGQIVSRQSEFASRVKERSAVGLHTQSAELGAAPVRIRNARPLVRWCASNARDALAALRNAPHSSAVAQ